MRVNHKITHPVKKGELIATQVNIFGEMMQEYFAPEDGIVIGHCVNPMGQTGARIMHLGVLMDEAGRKKFVEVSGCSLDKPLPGVASLTAKFEAKPETGKPGA